ncbi:MAG: ribosome recycling factor [Candidatus Cryosericum sp.]|nr:ribosome recycling factor [Candidatus Cryosericum sp.]HPS69520.1 ribosome recycling factor [Candidatus Cryosericum sp.]
MDKYFTPIDARMQAAHQALLKDYAEIRAGRITPAYLDGVVVEAYGQRTPLKDVATISAPQAKVLVVEPWDKNLLKEVERAILKANIGVTPTNDGQRVRLVFPDLTEEERKKMVARISQLTEKFREEVRAIRREVRDDIKAKEKAKELSEDEERRLEDELDKLTEKHIAEINQAFEAKEKEILSL